ncbi:MAG TPA: hypothetical protein VGP47_09895 [Parachlamydiaceae bacterium]|nr:hypothetical protein [Parachlamydiaceae bacterium]
MNIPERLAASYTSMKDSISTNLTAAAENATNYIGGKSEKIQEGRMLKLFPPAPFTALNGQELSTAKKASTAVFAPLLAMVYAPAAAYKNSLLKKQEVLTDKFNKMGRDSGVGPELKDVNKKLEGVDKLLKNLTETRPTLKHDLKNLKSEIESKTEELLKLKSEIDNHNEYIVNLASLPNIDPQTIKVVEEHVTELKGKVEEKENEINQLESQATKIEYRLASKSEKKLLDYKKRTGEMHQLETKMRENEKKLAESSPEEKVSLNKERAELNAAYDNLVRNGRPILQNQISIPKTEGQKTETQSSFASNPESVSKTEVEVGKPLPSNKIPQLKKELRVQKEQLEDLETQLIENDNFIANQDSADLDPLLELKKDMLQTSISTTKLIIDLKENQLANLEKLNNSNKELRVQKERLDDLKTQLIENDNSIANQAEGDLDPFLENNQAMLKTSITTTESLIALHEKQISEMEGKKV